MSALCATYLVFLSATAFFLASCKKYPTEPVNPVPVEAHGGYSGVANLDGGYTNVHLTIIAPDSGEAYSGSILYRGVNTPLTEARSNGAQDTLWFGYTRNSIAYQMWSEIQDIGLVVHVIDPADVPDYRVNREFASRNMTGYWAGVVSSHEWNGQNDANFSMDQRGALYAGTVTTAFFETYTYTYTSGSTSNDVFQLAGTLNIGGTLLPSTFSGQYSGRDRISGVWSAGENGSFDSGEFFFERSY